jgi:tight adherence protein B
VFEICFQKGGDMQKVVRNSYDMMGNKMIIQEEIQTMMTSNRTQQSVMSVVPIAIIAFLRLSSSSFAESFASATGVLTMTVAIGIFVGSFLYGRKIIDIKG